MPHLIKSVLSLWLNDFLVNNYSKIKYVSTTPTFSLEYIGKNGIRSKIVECEPIQFNSDDELKEFFDSKDGRTLVIYVIGKYIDLKTLNVFYRMRYSDITEKHEEREIKINKILQ